MADLVAQIANLVVVGEKRSTHLIAADKEWVRNHISLQLSGWAVDLYQLPAVFGTKSALRGTWVHTTTAYVRGVRPAQQAAAERLVADLCHLLSFASMSEVRAFAFSYGAIDRRWNGTGRVSDWRAPIEGNGTAVAAFVHETWASYRRLKRTRRLPELIHYLTLTDLPDQPLEIRMLLAFVALENAKATWASSKQIPYKREKFLKVSVRSGKTTKAPYKLDELLTLMFADVRMRPRLKRLVRVRNQIVHLGLTSREFSVNREYYERTKSLLHEYVLRLLGYTGAYYDYREEIPRFLTGAT